LSHGPDLKKKIEEVSGPHPKHGTNQPKKVEEIDSGKFNEKTHVRSLIILTVKQINYTKWVFGALQYL
jgi:hypothetical protein